MREFYQNNQRAQPNAQEQMTTLEEQMLLKEKILLGMELTYIRLIEFKKQKQSVLAVIENNEIKLIKPE